MAAQAHFSDRANSVDGSEKSLAFNGAQSVPILWDGRRSLARTSSSMILARDQTRELCCVAVTAPSPRLVRCCTVVPLITGLVLALMSPINSALHRLLASGTWTVFFSYNVSLVLTLLASLTTRCLKPGQFRVGVVRKFIQRQWYNILVLCGGILGLVPVLADTFAPDIIGVGMLSVGVVTGQTAVSILADRCGLFWRQPYNLPWPMYVGLMMVVVGAVIYRLDAILEFVNSSTSDTEKQLLFTGLGVLSGMARTSQTAINRKLAPLLGRHRDALALNYFVGGALMAVVVGAVDHRWPRWENATASQDWWKFTGGVLSLFSQTLAILSSKLFGMTQSALWSIASQICASMVLDHFGLLGLSRRPLSSFNAIGVTIVLVGVVFTDTELPTRPPDPD